MYLFSPLLTSERVVGTALLAFFSFPRGGGGWGGAGQYRGKGFLDQEAGGAFLSVRLCGKPRGHGCASFLCSVPLSFLCGSVPFSFVRKGNDGDPFCQGLGGRVPQECGSHLWLKPNSGALQPCLRWVRTMVAGQLLAVGMGVVPFYEAGYHVGGLKC